jgi:hypothetical protein
VRPGTLAYGRVNRRGTGRAWWLPALVAAAALAMAAAPAAAQTPDLSITPIAREGEVVVSFDLSDGFSADVRDAIQSGLPTTFSYDVELRRASALIDRTLASITIEASVRFDNLTRRYQMSRTIDGRVEDARPTEDQNAVRRWLTHFERVPLTPTTTLETNGEYYVRVRVQTRPRSGWFVWPWDRTSVLGNAKFTYLP